MRDTRTRPRNRPWIATAIAAVSAGALLGGAAGARAESAEGPGCVMPAWKGDATRGARELSGLRAGPMTRYPASTTGPVHILVLLAQFSDHPHRIDAARFEEHLFGPGPSMRSWYEDVSQDQIRITGEVVDWLTLPYTQYYYSQGLAGIGPLPGNAQSMVKDATAAAIAAGTDLGDFDADGDGVVDALLVVHSGQGYEWAGFAGPGSPSSEPDPLSINSHKWALPSSIGDFGAGLPRVVDYFTCPELQLVADFPGKTWTDSIATLGVFCHEFGHVLGLPDLYDTQNPTSPSRIGFWAVMDYGSWFYSEGEAPGSRPTHFCAWSKMFLEWTTPIVLAPNPGEIREVTLALQSTTTGGAPLQLLANPGGVDWSPLAPGEGEYFLAEVRTEDDWDSPGGSGGLVLYHVDESSATNRAGDHPQGGGLLVLLSPGDTFNLTSPGDDLWPGGQIEFGAASSPSSDFHDGTASGVVIHDIRTLSGESVTLEAFVPNLRSDVAPPFALPNPFRAASGGEVTLLFSLDLDPPNVTAVSLHDAGGRLVRRLWLSGSSALGGRAAQWDGRDASGRLVSSGVYYFRLEGSGPGTNRAGRVVFLR